MADHETHPIFTVFTYPMNRPDAAALYEALYEVYDNKDKLEKVFKLCCDPIYWKEVPVRDLIANYWIGALDVLAREGALKTLCKKVQEDSQSENLLFVREAIQAVLSARQTTLTKKVFEEYRLVLDRKLLRTNLQELLSSNAGARRVFLVRGEKGSGKTWCRWLFEQMAEDAQAAPACYCDKNTAPTVKDLLNQLFSSFDVRVEIETDEQGLLRNVAIVGETSWKVPVETTPSGWYRALCLELKKLAADRKKPLWIIMDDLGKDEDNQPILDEQIRLFFEQFVLSMNNTATGQWFRLMLINYR